MLTLNEYCEYISLGVRKTQKKEVMHCFCSEQILKDDKNWYSITMKSIKNMRIENVFEFEESREYMKFILQIGDIVISRIGPSFNSAIFDNAFPYENPDNYKTNVNIVARDSLILFSLKHSLKQYIDPYYVLYILNLDDTKKKLQEKAKGTKTKTINITDVLNIEIPEYNNEMKILTENFKNNLLIEGKKFYDSINSDNLYYKYIEKIQNVVKRIGEENIENNKMKEDNN